MANEVYLRGDFDMVYVWRDTAYAPIACLTSNTQDESTTFLEMVTKCNPGITQVTPGAWAGTISVEGVFIDTTSVGGETARASYDYLKEAQRNKTLLTLRMNADTIAPEYAQAYIESLSKTGAAGENITFSGSFRLMGLPTSTDPNAG